MPALSQAPAATSRRFAVGPYRPGPDGRLVPDPLPCCPYAREGETCDLGRQQVRHRASGPPVSLLTQHCRTHQRWFTIYPPGWFPYGRQPLVRLAPDGAVPLIETVAGADDATPEHKPDAAEPLVSPPPAQDARAAATLATLFAGTYLDPVLAAARGVIRDRWPVRGRPCWSTQFRRLRWAGLLLGIEAARNHVQETIAAILGVPALRVDVGATRQCHRLARLIRGVLLELCAAPRQLALRLLRSGAAAGLWARPAVPGCRYPDTS